MYVFYHVNVVKIGSIVHSLEQWPLYQVNI